MVVAAEERLLELTTVMDSALPGEDLHYITLHAFPPPATEHAYTACECDNFGHGFISNTCKTLTKGPSDASAALCVGSSSSCK